MMNLRPALACLLICSLWIAPKTLFALDCICTQYPMFPYSGGYWMHYAIQKSGNCDPGGPCPQIQVYTPNSEVCIDATNCGDCTTLGGGVDVVTVITSHLYITNTPPAYANVNTVDGIRARLRENINLEGTYLATARSIIDRMEFATPNGEAQPPVMRLSRKVGDADQTFYAVLWTMKLPGAPGGGGYLGVEITDAPAVTILPADTIYRAFVLASDEGVVQPIIVKGALEVKSGETVYMVRLLNRFENAGKNAYPTRFERKAEE